MVPTGGDCGWQAQNPLGRACLVLRLLLLLLAVNGAIGCRPSIDHSPEAASVATELDFSNWPPLLTEPLTQPERIELAGRQTSQLPPVDRVIVYALGMEEATAADGFPLRTHRDVYVNVLASRDLSGDDARQVADLWRRQELDAGESGFCHFPGYGLRFLSGSEVVFDTSICWLWHNFTAFVGPAAKVTPEDRQNNPPVEDADEPDEHGRDEQFVYAGFRAEGALGKELLAKLRALLPHPKPFDPTARRTTSSEDEDSPDTEAGPAE
jgi:hypothetical protein